MNGFDAELRRQQALLAAIADPAAAAPLRETGARAARGLAAYRANAHALAARALAAALPTVQAMLGDEDFAQLAREFWHAHPPRRGDIGEWGEALPDWLDAHAGLRDWPWLADAARLDLALHRAERAADGSFDAASLAWLQDTDPERLRLEPMPGSACLRSAWPVATIHAAHRGDTGFEAVRAALAEGRAEAVLVRRRGWRVLVQALGEAEAAWWTALCEGAPLADALRRAGAGFDFGRWLAQAIRDGALKGVARCGDRDADDPPRFLPGARR